jgi:hypothetical protein
MARLCFRVQHAGLPQPRASADPIVLEGDDVASEAARESETAGAHRLAQGDGAGEPRRIIAAARTYAGAVAGRERRFIVSTADARRGAFPRRRAIAGRASDDDGAGRVDRSRIGGVARVGEVVARHEGQEPPDGRPWRLDLPQPRAARAASGCGVSGKSRATFRNGNVGRPFRNASIERDRAFKLAPA